MLKDFDLLFNNARQYNEEGSMVYEDADFLEKLFKDKCKDLGILLPGTWNWHQFLTILYFEHEERLCCENAVHGFRNLS